MKLIPTSTQPVTITLYRGIPFSNDYEEHTFLSSKFTYKQYPSSDTHYVGNNKEAFINMIKDGAYVYPRSVKSGTYNFAFGNGIVTSVVMELTDNEINSNYMKVVSGTDTYYYFITGLTQKNEVTYLLNLELDVVMTYTDEFLDNMADKPVMTERKHCRRLMRYKIGALPVRARINPVCFNQESLFNGVKSNVVKEMTPLEFNDFVNGDNDFNDVMKELNWVYVIIGKNSVNLSRADVYFENGISYPYAINVFPTKQLKINYTINGQARSVTINPLQQYDVYVGQPSVQKIIISPFPPFNICSNIVMEETQPNVYEMNITNCDSDVSFWTGANNTGTQILIHEGNTTQPYPHLTIFNGCGGRFRYKPLTNYFDVDVPTLNDNIEKGEFKLEIAPFRDLRLSSYYGGEKEVHTQYKFLDTNVFDRNWNNIGFFTIATSNAECNSYYDCSNLTDYDVAGKRGISNSVAYSFPTGTDAELLYEQTAKNQYENSRIVGTITNATKIIGGMMALAFAPTPMTKGLGAIAMASGATSYVDVWTSWNAKMKDLANTPNTYNFSGSSLPYDMAISNSDEIGNKNLLPYIITYGTTTHELKFAKEYLYNNGYDYHAETIFNTEMADSNDDIFNRKLFNYVKINEDITTKLVGDNLPLIVAQKFNEILNAGIKLWTFFNFELSDEEIADDVLTKYFQKTTYCNAELTEENL